MKGREPIAACRFLRTSSSMDYQDAIDRYTYGSCHVFAIASVRKHGGRYLIVEDSDEIWWESDDGDQHAVIHVYAVHDTPDGLIARDIRGDRPLDQALDDAKSFFDIYEAHTHTSPGCGSVSSEADLMDLVDGPHERSTDMDPPLSEFSESDIEEAMKWVDWLPFIETQFQVRTDLLPPASTPSADEPVTVMSL
jgi:hypothetical protein